MPEPLKHPILGVAAFVLWGYSVVTFLVAISHPVSRYWPLSALALALIVLVFYEKDRRALLKMYRTAKTQFQNADNARRKAESEGREVGLMLDGLQREVGALQSQVGRQTTYGLAGPGDSYEASASLITQPWGTEVRQRRIPPTPERYPGDDE